MAIAKLIRDPGYTYTATILVEAPDRHPYTFVVNRELLPLILKEIEEYYPDASLITITKD
jgi:hypothetical protein